MTGSIILNENNLSPTGVFDATITQAPFNRLTLNMRGLNLQGRKIGVKKINLYYSWPNVRSGTVVVVGWKVGAAFTYFNWTIPKLTNYASVAELNSSLQTFCIANGLYHITSTGSNVYYLSLSANSSTYKIDLSLFKVPTSLPATYTQPANFAGYPTVSCTPNFNIAAGSELRDLLGLATGLYDGNTSAVVFSSIYVPQLNPVSCVFMTCNICKNDVPINGSTVIQCFTTRNTDFGAMIEVQPSEITYYDVDSNSNNLEVQFFDQNFNQLYVLDPQITVHLEVA
jgi:hypothetical protein